MTTPRIDPDDPKWTAYVLGEVDAAERAEIERVLVASAEARALVEELQVATVALKDELLPPLSAPHLRDGVMVRMLPEQREAVHEAIKAAAIKAAAGDASREPRRWFEVFPARWAWGLGAAAAAVVIGTVGILPFVMEQPESATGVQTAKLEDRAAPAAQVAQVVEQERAATPASETSRSAREERTSEQKEATTAGMTPPSAGPSPAPSANAAKVIRIEELDRNGTSAARGSLTGVVTDPSGSLIPGVAITALNAQTGVATTTVTNEAGAYSFPNLEAGRGYRVSAALPGFQTKTITSLDVSERQQARADIPLEIASAATMLEVSVDAASLLKSSSASVGEVLPQRDGTNLPLVDNNVLNLAAVVAGVRQDATAATARDGLAPTFELEQGPQGQGGQTGTGAGQAGQLAAGARGGGGGGRGGGGGNGRGAAAAAPPPPPPARPAPPPPPPPPAVAAPTAPTATIAGFNREAVDYRFRDQARVPGTEAYDRIVDNPFIRAIQEPLATFSIDVDTASYANVRRFLNQNQLPPRDAVRIEELVNYFNYDYEQPRGQAPIAPNMEVASAPWNPRNRLVRIGIKAREIDTNRRPASNLVFLVDVSGSMQPQEKLPLLKSGLKMLVNNLSENDFVSMVVYAGASGLVLPPTSGMRKDVILQAVDNLQAGGSTNGGAGIQLAYNQAVANFIRGGVNRVILMTDGDFNVGITNQGDLTRLIEDRARSGVFLSVLGFGMGNLKDSTMEKLADMGNGHYAYIDTINEARKVLVEEMGGTLVTVAKDVKIQVDFNPGRVEAYRLIGYENRVLRAEDFNNDLKDAGDMGAGHTVTALFEVVPRGGVVPGSVDPSRYQVETDRPATPASTSNEMLTLRVRYKLPDAAESTRMDVPLTDRGAEFSRASQDFRFAASVASFGMVLRDSPYKGTSTMRTVLDIATGSRGQDRNGYRTEFISLVRRAASLGR